MEVTCAGGEVAPGGGLRGRGGCACDGCDEWLSGDEREIVGSRAGSAMIVYFFFFSPSRWAVGGWWCKGAIGG